MTKDWSKALQSDIQRLYHEKGLPLTKVMADMKAKHGFQASERAYRSKLQEWGYAKYNTATNSQAQKIKKKARGGGSSRAISPTSSISSSLPGIDGNSNSQNNLPEFPELDSNTNTWLLNGEFNTRSQDAINPYPYHGFSPSLSALGLRMPSTPGIRTPSVFGSRIPRVKEDEQDSDGKTELHRVSGGDDTERVRALLKAHASVDIKDLLGNQPLHYAAEAKKLEHIKLLLQFGADVNARGHKGRSPLHLALPCDKCVQALLQRGADPSNKDDAGDTALHLVLLDGSISESLYCINTLLRGHANANLPNALGLTPFHKLLDRSYGPCSYPSFESPACTAITDFLSHDADISIATPDGRSPFQIFLARSPRAVLMSPGKSNWVSNPNKILKEFLAKGANPLTPFPTGESFVLKLFDEFLAKDRSIDADLMKLICQKVTTEPIGPNRTTILHEMCLHCRAIFQYDSKFNIMEAITILLDRGADPKLLNNDGQSPLLLTFIDRYEHPVMIGIAKILLAYNVDPMMPDRSERFPLFEAAKLFPAKDLKIILKADMSYRSTTQSIALPSYPTWVNTWHQGLKETDWDSAKSLIRDLSAPISPETHNSVRKSALAVLAEKHIREDSKNIAEDQRRDYVTKVLRDCRAWDLPIEMGCYDTLLELC